MAANPSALLLLTCVTCADAANNPTLASVSTCPDQNQSQDDSAIAVTEAVHCISSPETVAAMQPVRSSVIANAQDLGSPNQPPARLDSAIPRPAPPEAFYAMLTANSGQTSGQTSEETNRQSESMPLLRVGSRGEVVSQLQTQLQQMGHYTGGIDGIYGKKTEAAVAKFQQVNGLGVDGVVGASTWQKLQARSGGQSTTSPASASTDSAARSQAAQPQAAQPQATEPSVAIEPEETESAPAAPELRPEETTAPRTVERDPVENENLYYWLLIWALVYGGGNVFIFWNRTISNLWFNLLEKISPQRSQKSTSKPTTADDASAKPTATTSARRSASSHAQSVPSTANSTIDRATPSSVSASTATPHNSPNNSSVNSSKNSQISSSISMDAEQQAQTNGHLASSISLPQEQSTARSPGIEPVLVAALANGGLVEPLKNLVVDSSPSSRRQPSTQPHRIPQSSRASTLRGYGFRNSHPYPRPHPLASNAPVTSQKNGTDNQSVNQRVTQISQATTSSSQLNNEPNRASGNASILVATLPVSDPKTGNTYTYTLLNDAEGCFKLEGNELRILNEVVSTVEDKVHHIVTVRRTDAKGISADKSFVLNLSKTENVKPKTPVNASIRPIQSLRADSSPLGA